MREIESKSWLPVVGTVAWSGAQVRPASVLFRMPTPRMPQNTLPVPA
jgi:hypothetical protein